MKKLAVVLLLSTLMVSALAPANAATKGNTRKWKATYNSALSLHEAAVPKVYKVGTKLKVSYNGHSIWVRAINGGCTCFDLSDEGFKALAGSTSKGVITVTVKKL